MGTYMFLSILCLSIGESSNSRLTRALYWISYGTQESRLCCGKCISHCKYHNIISYEHIHYRVWLLKVAHSIVSTLLCTHEGYYAHVVVHAADTRYIYCC
jgi:hypothetical protein